MSGRHALDEPIALPGWRFAAVLASLGLVPPLFVLHHQAMKLISAPPADAAPDYVNQAED